LPSSTTAGGANPDVVAAIEGGGWTSTGSITVA
jgi:hypothetical protein